MERAMPMPIVLGIAVAAVTVTIFQCERSRSTAQTAAISLTQGQPALALPATELTGGKDAIANMLEPWHGDLDGMVARRYVRM